MTQKKIRHTFDRNRHIAALRESLSPGDPVWILSSRGTRVPGQLVSIDPIAPVASVKIDKNEKVTNICMLDIMDEYDDVQPTPANV